MSNVLYILMRNDMPSMNSGKAMAQASHASNAFIHKYLDVTGPYKKAVKEWTEQTKQGFGTVTVLSVDKVQLHQAMAAATEKDFPCELVFDPTYPYIVNAEIASLIPSDKSTSEPVYRKDGQVVLFRNEITCGYVFGPKEDLAPILGSYPLHP